MIEAKFKEYVIEDLKEDITEIKEEIKNLRKREHETENMVTIAMGICQRLEATVKWMMDSLERVTIKQHELIDIQTESNTQIIKNQMQLNRMASLSESIDLRLTKLSEKVQQLHDDKKIEEGKHQILKILKSKGFWQGILVFLLIFGYVSDRVNLVEHVQNIKAVAKW